MLLLAQTQPPPGVPGGQETPLVQPLEVAWSAFAPELVVSGVALALLLLIIARHNRSGIGVVLGGISTAVGLWLASQDLWVPAVVAIFTGVVGAGIVVAFRDRPTLGNAWLAALALLGALGLTAWQWADVVVLDTGVREAQLAVGGSIALDGIAFFTRIVVYLSALLTIPVGYGYLHERRIHRPDFEPLILLASTGMALLGAAADLITLFVALEILSLALYILAGLARRDRRSQEAAIKYFVLGAVAAAVLLYGLALIYVATGTLDIAVISDALGLVTTPDRLALLGVALVTVGLGFKVALVPFHLWIPDVYQGAPTNVTMFMAAATKAAAFAAILRLFGLGFERLADIWAPIVAVLTAVTMIVGAVLAIVQTDVKRILAYSSIAHAGYAAIGVVAGGAAGRSGTLWYLLTYAVSVIAAFGAVLALERRRRGEVTLIDLKGLGRRSPMIAGMFSLALLSLAGIPPTAGFAGKWVVFSAGVDADWTWLVVVGVISTVIAAFFYLRLMAMMYLEEPEEDGLEPRVTTGLSVGISFASAAVILLGVGTFLDLAEQAALLAR
ncbi:MAG: NADH-quinone oxidoreductase subunit N [Actinobacteria bacterium]|nr:NADH-quinone oxidoreductase subunit N [Actinomycetota bacterium]